MAQQTICPRCAKRLPPAAKFCRRCGTTQKVSASRADGAAFPLPPMPSGGHGPFPSYAPYPPTSPTPLRSKRPSSPRRASCGAGSGTWGGARGGWIIALLVIFCVRACITTTSNHWHSDPPPAPEYRWTPPQPPVDLDELTRHLQQQQQRDPFDRDYFPDRPQTPPAPPTPPDAPTPPDGRTD